VTVGFLGANLLLVWVVFGRAHWIMGLTKEGGAKGIGKVSSLLLAAFAMMMIRKGIEGWRGYCAEMNDGPFLLALSAIDDYMKNMK
jgi:small neutral amino acid transporter SnatA (MarC family)